MNGFKLSGGGDFGEPGCAGGFDNFAPTFTNFRPFRSGGGLDGLGLLGWGTLE